MAATSCEPQAAIAPAALNRWLPLRGCLQRYALGLFVFVKQLLDLSAFLGGDVAAA